MKTKYKTMMKTGIGLVALGAAMSAAAQQTQIQMYGLVGAYVARTERSDGRDAVTQLGHGGLTTSYWGVRGSEDLGSGLKAVFALESFFQTDTGGMGRSGTDPLFSRNAFVGFEGGFGKLTLGRQTNPTYVNMGNLSPFGVSVVFSPLVLQSFVASYNGTIFGDTVWNNVVQYSSPRVGGFAGSVLYGLGEQAGSNGRGANLGLHANYADGPLSAGFSAQRVRSAAQITAAPAQEQQTAYLLGAAYDFRVVKVFGSVLKTDTDGVDNKSRTYDLGVKVPVSASGSVLAEYAHTKREFETAADNTRKTASIGYDHFLSKRTDVYAIYSYDKQTGFDSGNSFGVGIRHTF